MVSVRRDSLLSQLLLFILAVRIVEGLVFLRPTKGTPFSSTDPNLIVFKPESSDPSLIDIYIFSSSTAPFGPSHLRLLASSINPTIGRITFTPVSKNQTNSNTRLPGNDALPPSADSIYSLVAVPTGQKNALAHSDLFNVAQGPIIVSEGRANLSDYSSNQIDKGLNSTTNSSGPVDVRDDLLSTSSNISISSQDSDKTSSGSATSLTGASRFDPLPPGVGIGGLGDQRKKFFLAPSSSTSSLAQCPPRTLSWLIAMSLVCLMSFRV